MEKRILFTLALMFVLANVFVLMPRVQSAWTGTVYIRANGDIDPADAPIQRNGDIYTLTGNITSNTDGIVIERDNITLDGADHSVQGMEVYESKGINLTRGKNVTIKNMEMRGFHWGIWLYEASNNTVISNNLTANRCGISLGAYSENNTVVRNRMIANGWYGIFLTYASNNTISQNDVSGSNTILNTGYGIALVWFSEHNKVSGNNFIENHYGIMVQFADNNTLYGNIVARNAYCGIRIYGTSNNTIYHNSLIENTNQTMIDTPGNRNFWDDGFEGNYWSNYTGADLEPDGIGNSPYVIDAYNQDNYPLMGMFHCFDMSMGTQVNVISNSTVEDFQYFDSNNTIVMHVSNKTSGQTFGFVRICIPHALMDDTYQVMINGAEPYYVNYTLYDNGSHRWIYFSYQHSTLEIIIVPEFPSFLILQLFTIATLLATIVYKRKHIKNNRG